MYSFRAEVSTPERFMGVQSQHWPEAYDCHAGTGSFGSESLVGEIPSYSSVKAAGCIERASRARFSR